MASAEQFLQLLEEKDLVAAQVLQAARREAQRTSPPPDAVGISLWLVQGQHITASQAERLLAAVMEKTSDPRAGAPPSFSRWQKGEPKPTEVLRVPIPPPPAPPRFAPHVPESPPAADRGESPPRKPQSAAQEPLDDLELAPEPVPGHAAARKPVATAAPQAGPKPAASPKAANAGGKLEPLEKTMKGPLDSLIEGEADQSSPFHDTTGGPSLVPAAPKKFKLRHVLRKLFRRNKSKTVKVKAADPRQVKLILYSWGVAVFVILAGLAIFRYFSPDAAEILRKAEAAVDRGDNTEAINQYDKFLNTYPKAGEADEVHARSVHWPSFAEPARWRPHPAIGRPRLRSLKRRWPRCPRGRLGTCCKKLALRWHALARVWPNRHRPSRTTRRSSLLPNHEHHRRQHPRECSSRGNARGNQPRTEAKQPNGGRAKGNTTNGGQSWQSRCRQRPANAYAAYRDLVPLVSRSGRQSRFDGGDDAGLGGPTKGRQIG